VDDRHGTLKKKLLERRELNLYNRNCAGIMNSICIIHSGADSIIDSISGLVAYTVKIHDIRSLVLELVSQIMKNNVILFYFFIIGTYQYAC